MNETCNRIILLCSMLHSLFSLTTNPTGPAFWKGWLGHFRYTPISVQRGGQVWVNDNFGTYEINFGTVRVTFGIRLRYIIKYKNLTSFIKHVRPMTPIKPQISFLLVNRPWI